MYDVVARLLTCALATIIFALAGAREAASAFWSAAVFFSSMLSLLYDSVTSSSWLDIVSIFLVSSAVDGAACAAVAIVPVSASDIAATTSDRSLVRGVGTGCWPFFRL